MKAPLPENDTRPRFIYLLTNKKNGKQYVGQAVDVNDRWYKHKGTIKQELPEMIIDRAIKKYGADGFVWEVIACCRTLSDVNETENLLVKQHDCQIPKGYNVSPGGGQAPVHERTRRLISKAQKGEHHSPETEFKKGHKPTTEVIERIAAANAGRIPWNKGTEGAMKPNSGSFSPGHTTWNKGTAGVMVAWNKGLQGLDVDYVRGSKHPLSVLNEEQVLEIVKLDRQNTRAQNIADQFNVKLTTIYSILQGRRWSHLTGIHHNPQPKKKIDWPEPTILLKMIEELGNKAVAEKFGVSHAAARKYLKREGII